MNNNFYFLLSEKRSLHFSFVFLLLGGFIIFPSSLAAQSFVKRHIGFQQSEVNLKIVEKNTPVDQSRPALNSEVGLITVKAKNINNPVGIYSSEMSHLEQQIFQVLNQERVKYNLMPLVWSEQIADVARMHSADMARYGFLSHMGKDGSSVSKRADMLGVHIWRGIEENIAYNQRFKNPAEFACERWMISEKHRANVLEPHFKETGIGVAVSQDGTYYFTQVFILR
jgi:uncharacterized protein YkwD